MTDSILDLFYAAERSYLISEAAAEIQADVVQVRAADVVGPRPSSGPRVLRQIDLDGMSDVQLRGYAAKAADNTYATPDQRIRLANAKAAQRELSFRARQRRYF